LSAAPQAVPHAAGVSSGLSAAPQAVPHAADVSSGLSAAPQAVPHAAAVPSSIFLLQLKRLKSAILLFLLLFHKTISCLQDQCTLFPPDTKVRTILLLSYLFITHGFHWYVPL
jgi:hypothetical protein